jgi:threonine dehydrogenase-like Zn-dependent dehydrogenase
MCGDGPGDGHSRRHRSRGWRYRSRRRSHYETVPSAQLLFYKNIIVGGGPAPVRAYIEELLPDIMEGRISPGRVFDREVGLDGVPEGYRAMNDRESIKVMVKP